MKPRTALKEWGASYRLSWHCVRGRYYGWVAELAMILFCTALFPLFFLLTLVFVKEPDHAP